MATRVSEEMGSKEFSFSSVYYSITTSPTVQKIAQFVKDKGYACFTYAVPVLDMVKTYVTSFYEKYSSKISHELNKKRTGLIFTISALTLGYCFPMLSLIGIALGLTSIKMFPNFKPSLEIEVAATAIGAGAIALPVCSLSVLTILAGTVALGRAGFEYYSAIIQ